MCLPGGSAPPPPVPPPKIPEAAQAPKVPAKRAGTAGADEARRRAAAGEGRSTILTSPRGVQNGGTTAQKTLLGL